MAVIYVPFPITENTGSSGGGSGSGESGHSHENLNLLNSLKVDSSGRLTFNGVVIGEKAIEKSYLVTLTTQHIADKFIELPEDCDTSRAITMSLEGVNQVAGDDWEIVERAWPEKDLLSWSGLSLDRDRLARAGDRVSITYYARS